MISLNSLVLETTWISEFMVNEFWKFRRFFSLQTQCYMFHTVPVLGKKFGILVNAHYQ